MAVGTVDGEITLHVKPSQLRDEAIRSGNNFITILHDEETVAELHPAIQSWVASVYENTRSGMMLRVVPGGIVSIEHTAATMDSIMLWKTWI